METTIANQNASRDSLQGRVREIAQRLREQDNRCTELPIFLVRTKRRIYGFDPQYSDVHVWIDSDGNEADEVEQKDLDARYEDNYSETHNDWTRTSYLDIWEVATVCLTEKGCKDYIAKMAHRLHEPQIYVESSYRNDEWRDVLEYLSNAELCGSAVKPKGTK
jgi:hypothetical protein